MPGSKLELIPEMRCNDIQFSPNNKEFSIATTEGIIIYSSDRNKNFQPIELDESITPKSIYYELNKKNYLMSLQMSIRLNNEEILSNIFLSIPKETINLTSREISTSYISRFILFISNQIDKTKNLELCLYWIKGILISHGKDMKNNNTLMSSILRGLLREINEKYKYIYDISNQNLYNLNYLLSFNISGEKRKFDTDVLIQKSKIFVEEKEKLKKPNKKKKISY
jgi:periodic tryptophan protein 2